MQAAQFFGPVFDLNWPANLKPKMKAKKKLRKRIKRKLSAGLPATAKELKGYGVVWGIDKQPLRVSHLTHWRTREGVVMLITDMQDNHLLNARALLRRRIARLSEVEEVLSREVARRGAGKFKTFEGTVQEFFDLLAKHDDTGKYPDARDLWDAYGGNSE
jgi:hypothetical protein